jgi:PAS domain S-box-containing protein
MPSRELNEEALRASEEQYRAIFAAATDSLQLLDAQHRVVDVNPAYERMYGKRREEVIGKTLDELVPAPLREERRALVGRALAGGAAELLTTGYRGDGTPFDLEVRVIPFQHHGALHVLGIARDITERKRTEEAMRGSEEQYRAIFNASADALVLRDADFRIVDVNATYERMSGWTRDEVLGIDHVIANPTEVAPTIRALHSRALNGEPVALEVPLVRRDGTRYELELRGVPIQHRGQPHVLYIGRDVTERKLAEHALRASEEQYRSIFNASADAMLLRDDAMTIVDANPAFLSLCGLPREQVVGRAHAPFVVETFEVAAEGLLRDALGGVRGSLEAQARSHDGTLLDVEVRAMPMLYRGRPHVLAIARNITADKRAEAERLRYEARLRQAQKMEAIGQLTGGIAHDFNNILASVMGYVVLAEERATDSGDAKSADYLGQALGSCRRARDLIQQMLTFSRGGRGEPRALSLPALVRDAIPMMRSALPSTLAIDVVVDADLPAVWMDEVQAHQVLLNLSINARDAMPDGGTLRIAVAPTVIEGAICSSCRHAVDGRFVELRVSDTGGGIDSGLLERIFDPFFTTKAPGKGTGMGLSMVHGIVHEYRGHVLVETVVGMGTTFRVMLPAHSAPAVVPAKVGGQAPVHTMLRGRVLLVDDEPSVLAVLRETLLSWGLTVEACASVEAAERAFVAAPESFDLMVTDHAMPQMTGIELAERLRARLPTLRWLLCTGFADEASVARARALGALAVLHKPVEPLELRTEIQSALQTARVIS